MMDMNSQYIREKIKESMKENQEVKLSNQVLQQAQLQGFIGKKYIRPKTCTYGKRSQSISVPSEPGPHYKQSFCQ